MRLLLILVLVTISYSNGHTPEEYIGNNKTNGYTYKLVYYAESWDVAKEKCTNDKAKLAVPKSKEQFEFIQSMVRGMHYPSIIGAENRLVVWLGINNKANHTEWINIDGENINNTGFHEWSGWNGENTSSDPREPHCVVIDAINPGLRQYWCHLAQPYICEKKI